MKRKAPSDALVPWQVRYRQRFYDTNKGWVDGTSEFHSLIKSVLTRGGRILEIGSGPANSTTAFLSTLGEVHGVDPDQAVLTNPHLTSARVLTSEEYPYPDDSFDLCVSNYVIEHVNNGDEHLKEVARVLKPGGAYAFRTVNRKHYVAILASITPHWFHKRVANRARALDEDSHDPYPTVYRLNTGEAVRRAANLAGLSVERLLFVEKEPSYGMFARAAFLLMVGYERLVNSASWLSELRANMFVVLRK